MTINIKTTNLELTDAIRKYAEDKVGEALSKYTLDIIQADIEVGKTSAHHQKGEIFRAEVNVQIPGKLVRAETVHEDLYAAIDKMRDILLEELRKQKEKIVSERKRFGRVARLMKSVFFWRERG